MKISLDWLSDFITLKEQDPEAIARVLTAKVSEVDRVEMQGGSLRGVVVGKILSLRKHPNADKLSLCDVQTDQGMRKIVCGGTNLREGMIVPVAHVGATVKRAAAGGETATIERVTIRGEESNGMVCAAEELGLEERFPPKPEEGARPVLDLTPLNLKVGSPLLDALGLGDVVLHIDNHAITHRPDLFSHVGYAQEFVAAGLAEWKNRPATKEISFPDTPLPFQCIVDSKKLMPRYCACLLEIKDMGETPAWMVKRLASCGIRSISLPVDITNFVMLEIGVPLHSFDASDFKGDLHVRAAKKGEHITTLDGIDRELPKGAIVISDDEGIFDLLGIMGGLRSSTKATTQRIYLHAASLDPVAIRRTANATGHRTDAATIYEKGVPPIRSKEAFLRALQLFLSLVPGAHILSSMESVGDDGKTKPITLKLSRLQRVLGAPIGLTEASKILKSLGFAVEEKKNALAVTPPLWRLGDIHSDDDLIEEIGRIHGYEAIEAVQPTGSLVPPPRDARLHRVRSALKEEGFFELQPLSLVGEKLLAKAGMSTGAVTVENPIGEELGLLRTSTIPAILEHAAQNLAHVKENLSTFECAHVFSKTQGEWSECGLLLTDKREGSLKETPFLKLKDCVMEALRKGGWQASVRTASATAPFGHPGRTADLFVGEIAVGFITEVHPEVATRFDLPAHAAVATLDLTTLLAIPELLKPPAPVPAFPAVSYDVTVMRTQTQSSGELLKKLKGTSPLLESVEIADLYEGKPLSAEQYNLTLRFIYRAPDRTLTEDEAKREHEKALQLLK